MANGKVTALTLSDMSAAFDTIDHSTLLERLYGHFGIYGTVFKWFKSYISNRQQRVIKMVHFHARKIFILASHRGLSLALFCFVYTQRQ